MCPLRVLLALLQLHLLVFFGAAASQSPSAASAKASSNVAVCPFRRAGAAPASRSFFSAFVMPTIPEASSALRTAPCSSPSKAARPAAVPAFTGPKTLRPVTVNVLPAVSGAEGQQRSGGGKSGEGWDGG